MDSSTQPTGHLTATKIGPGARLAGIANELLDKVEVAYGVNEITVQVRSEIARLKAALIERGC